MADLDLQQIDAKTGKAPKTRIVDAASFNSVVRKIVERDLGSALNRQDVQRMLDGAPPYEPVWLTESGQEGRSNLNFQDGKKEVRRKMLGYYDLTDSVPVLGIVHSEFGKDVIAREEWNHTMSEEFHRMVKDWPSFSSYFQLLIQKFCGHGLGFVYRGDDLDWKWWVAGLEDFKVPRGTTLAEDEVDLAVCFRDVTAGRLYKWAFVDSADDDTRWNKQEVKEAILKAADSQLVFSVGAWEKYEQMLKNNDIWAASMAQDVIKLVHGWVVEYSGKVSQYLSLRNGGNKDFLFKCENRYESVHQCFTFFPYEVGTNGQLHSVRGRAHEVYAQVQSLTLLRNQEVDNAKFAGSLVLQPLTPEDEEDLSITFYGGAIYIPANVKIPNAQLNNPSQALMPIVQDMTLLLRDEGIPSNNTPSNPSQKPAERTRTEYLGEEAKAAVLDTAALTLFYEPWKRVLNESWRRVCNPKLKATDPGGREVFDFRRRCMARGVPDEALKDVTSWIEPMRAIGFGSPANRIAALDEFMQYYGNLDPVGQNNLLRDRFAQKVGYAQVDRYVPTIGANGRQPFDAEICELQNVAMSAGKPMKVLPNDHHIIHLQSHQPDIETDLSSLEANEADPNAMIPVVQMKLQHISQHLQLLKPDKLQEDIVAELKRRFNNEAERVQSAIVHAQREAVKQQQAQQAQQGQQQQAQSEDQVKAAGAQQKMQLDAAGQQQDMAHKQAAHEQSMQQAADVHSTKLKNLNQEAAQTRALRDAETAQKLQAAQGGQTQPPEPSPEVPAKVAAIEQKTDLDAAGKRQDLNHKQAEHEQKMRHAEEMHKAKLKAAKVAAEAPPEPKPKAKAK
jgi:hypothetical protein